MSQDILRVSFPTELMTWIENNAHNYEVTAEEYLIILIKSEMRRGNEIAKNGNKLVVVTSLKIFPGKIIVLGFRRICRQSISQYILHIRKFLQIFMQPNRPVFGG